MPSTIRTAYLEEVRALHAEGADFARLLRARTHRDARWHGPCPLDDLEGVEAIEERFWRPLRRAFPDLERCDDILIAGTFAEREWIGAMGVYRGRFAEDWLGIPATGGLAWLRFGEFSAVEDGVVHETYLLLDILDLMRQAGVWPLPASLGMEGAWSGPSTHDGLLLAPPDPGEGQRTLDLAQAMGAGLRAYDGNTLASMGQARFWHPQMMWYGPAGIGSTRGLADFETFHQTPFLTSFPDRVGGDHRARFGDGRYAGWVGWPSVRATHTGGGWLGLAPTGRAIAMRVMDFYRREDSLLRENWVFIDLLDVLRQMGVDPFARIATRRGGA